MKICYQYTDLQWRLSQIPESAACRGVFFNVLDERAADFGTEIQNEYRNFFKLYKFNPLRLHPVKDYLTRIVKLAELKYGGPDIYRGIAEIQSATWPAWRRTLIGRATLGILGKNFHAILKMQKNTFKKCVNYGGFELEQRSTNQYVTTHRGEYVYIDHAMVGGVRGAAVVCDTDIQVEARLTDPFNGELWITVVSTSAEG